MKNLLVKIKERFNRPPSSPCTPPPPPPFSMELESDGGKYTIYLDLWQVKLAHKEMGVFLKKHDK